MKRPEVLRRSSVRVAAVAAVSILAVLAGVLFVASGPLDAQQPAPASFNLGSTEAAGDGFELDVAFAPGDERVGAVSGVVTYDSALMTAIECVPGMGGGSCNANVPGIVRFALFDPAGFAAGNLVTIRFSDSGAGDTSNVDLSLRAIYGLQGEALTQPAVVEGGSVTWIGVSGDLTGEVTVGGTGEGLYDALVCATGLGGDPDAADVLEECVSTDGLGNFTFSDLLGGEYAVTVTDPSGLYASAQDVALVEVDATAVLLFELDPAAMPDPTVDEEVPPVIDEEAPPVVDEEAPPVVDEEVVDDIEGAPPAAELPVDDAPAPTEDDAVDETGVITGTVTDSATGDAIFGASVCATVPVVGTTQCQYTNMSGEYIISGLQTNNYVVTATDPILRFTSGTELLVGVFAGTTVSGADLTLTPRG